MEDGVGDPRLTVGHFESLFDDLEAFLVSSGLELPEGFGDRARSMGPVRPSSHRRYRDYYDDDLRELAGRCCSGFVESFGYEF